MTNSTGAERANQEPIDRSVPAINGRPWTFNRFDNYIRYVSGVLRGQREQEEYRLA
jgi:hypothetical protein